MWAARPHLASIFEKLLDQKTFSCLRLGIGNLTSRNTTQIRLGKAGAHPQLALGIAIAPEILSLITTFWFWRQLRFFRCSLRFLFYFNLFSLICFANVGCSPTPRQHFWKTAAPKNFSVRLRLGASITIPIKKQESLWFEKSLLFYQWLETVRFSHSVIPTIKTANNNK